LLFFTIVAKDDLPSKCTKYPQRVCIHSGSIALTEAKTKHDSGSILKELNICFSSSIPFRIVLLFMCVEQSHLLLCLLEPPLLHKLVLSIASSQHYPVKRGLGAYRILAHTFGINGSAIGNPKLPSLCAPLHRQGWETPFRGLCLDCRQLP
jgi:hypothetical protein